MKNTTTYICLITGLCLSALSHAGQFDSFKIYYVNGMANYTENDARTTRNQLSLLAIPDAYDVSYLYQKNGSVPYQLLQSYEQNYTDGSRDKYKNFGKWLMHLNLAPTRFMENVYWPVLARWDQYSYTSGDPYLQRMVNMVNSVLQTGERVILVAHSQGNFYANQVANYIQTNTPYGLCLGVVGVATPATNVAGNSGPYTTLKNDLVINGARTTFPWGSSILPGNSGPITTADSMNHNMTVAYLVNLAPQIRQQIINVATAVNNACPPPESPPPPPPTGSSLSCGTPINSKGSTGTYDYVQTIGQGTQTVVANFEAYSIPDQLEIFAGSTRLVSTKGLVSGFHQIPFTFDSAALGTTQITARVTGNGDPNTLWTLCVDCSSGTTCSSALPRRSVSVSMSYTWTSQWYCTAGSISIDGGALGNLASGVTINTTLTAGTENHVISAPGAGCTCTLTTGCSTNPDAKYLISYKDGTGATQLVTGPLTKQFGFIVN